MSDSHSDTQTKFLNILVVRPDRLGDVILSTPVLEVLKQNYPHARITVMVRASVAPLLRGLPEVSEVLIYDPEGVHRGLKGLFRLIQDIRERHFRIVIVLHSVFQIAAALFAAGVRYRVGPYSKLHSYFFFNRGLRQARSNVEMHEVEYNLQLLRRIGVRVEGLRVRPKVFLPEEARAQGEAWLRERGWEQGKGELIVVHPGMGGSALNWPLPHYVEMIRALVREGKSVVVTGGAHEETLLRTIETDLKTDAEKVWFFGGKEAKDVTALGGIFAHAQVVVAPSTGPLHLATALGRAVVTFYSPIRVQSAIRWGPYTETDEESSVLVPEVFCGQDFKCLGPLCNYFLCMKSVVVTQVLEEVHQQLGRQRLV